MNATTHQEIEAIERADAYLVDESQFFAPVAADLFSELLGQYKSMRERIEAVSALMLGESAGAAAFLLEGNRDESSRYYPNVEKAFSLKGGIAALNSHYWSKTLALTDVREMMPQKRRNEWDASIRDMKTPDFTEEAVRPTITELLNMRQQFLSERVDGIFRSLSGDHVTNVPEGFGKRMIFAGMLSYHDAYSQRGVVNDLRCVIAKFMGRDEPTYKTTDVLIEALKRNYGQWVTLDGGALKIRLYMKGTAHLEVHPDMAWRLNSILASMYPLAIPAQFRQKPTKKAKTFDMMQRPLPFKVLDILGNLEPVRTWSGDHRNQKSTIVPNTRRFGYGARNKAVTDEAIRILEAIGGAQVADGEFHFDYEPGDVLREIVTSGCVPDQKAHQYYPTPETLARIAVDLAAIEEGHTVLEPSAGMGGLAALLPKEQTECVEISALHCKVLESKGYRTQQADFLNWRAGSFNRIVMNPPFSEGRWQAHTEHAATMLRDKGVLVAILPSSARNRFTLDDLQTEWHGPYDNEFAGTSVSVVILKAARK